MNKERYVANFDILGMSSLTRTNQDRAIAMLHDFYDIIVNHVGKMAIEIVDSNEIIIDRIEKILFSDTVIVFTKGNSKKDLYAIVILCSELFGQSLHRCIPIRGGIAFGNLFYDNQTGIICGSPLVEAHELEKTSKWLGISVTEDIAQKIQKADIKVGNGQSSVIDWNIQPINRKVINWPSVFEKNFQASIPITTEQFYEAFKNDSGNFDKLSDSIKEKYENTVAFVNACLSKNND